MFVLFKLSKILIALSNSIPFLTGVPVDGIYSESIASTSNEIWRGELPTKSTIFLMESS